LTDTVQPLKQTPLHALHRRLGARMVPFAGYEMPLQYRQGIIAEHLQTRARASLFDVSHMGQAILRGDDAIAALESLVVADLQGMPAGTVRYTLLTNEQGGIIDDLIIYFLTESWFRIVVNAGTADKDVAWILKQRDALAPGLEITPRRDLAMIAVQGPNARAKVWQVLPGSQAVTEDLKIFQSTTLDHFFIARTGYTGEDGFEIILPAEEAPTFWKSLHAAGVAPAGLGARDTLRLEAGMNLYGQDMDESTSPLESGLNWTVDLKSERDFIGKQALLDSNPKQQLAGLVLLDRGVLRSHQKVVGQVNGQAFEGEITSGGFSPTINQSIALARIDAGVSPGDEVHVLVRDKQLRAKVVKYPFVRNGKVLI